ncbi:hypothetical protein CBF23_003205 [Marinomonas agarivorans]|nr:hypothetical protein CBF23_003205 [Marinomonas agarivorans]
MFKSRKTVYINSIIGELKLENTLYALFFGHKKRHQMVPSYGNKSNQNDSLTVEWGTLEEANIHQYEALFEELKKWNECLEKSSNELISAPQNE